MKRLILFLLSAIFLSTPFAFCAEETETVKVVVFYSDECEECLELLEKFFPELQERYKSSVSMIKLEISDQKNYEILSRMENAFGRPVNDWPALFLFNSVLIGKNEIYKNIDPLIRSLHEKEHFAWPPGYIEGTVTKTQNNNHTLEKKIASLTVLTVIGAGLFDGINPCAFTTIIFLIFYMNFIGRNKKQILVIGVMYTLAVLITYFSIGFGFLKIIQPLVHITFINTVIYCLGGFLALFFAFFSLLDYFKAKKGNFRSMFLQLTHGLKEKIHKTVRESAKTRGLIIFAIVIGFFIALFELPCTGQVYLPIIIAISNRVLYTRALLLLIMYNIMFIAPLVIIFAVSFFGVSSTAINNLFTDNIARIKIITALIFFLLALILFVAAF